MKPFLRKRKWCFKSACICRKQWTSVWHFMEAYNIITYNIITYNIIRSFVPYPSFCCLRTSYKHVTHFSQIHPFPFPPIPPLFSLSFSLPACVCPLRKGIPLFIYILCPLPSLESCSSTSRLLKKKSRFCRCKRKWNMELLWNLAYFCLKQFPFHIFLQII